MDQRPYVGLGVLVLRDDKVLIGQRLNSLGAGEYALPGGHLEFGEELEECAAREVLEETGLHISGMQFAAVANTVFPQGRHYVTIFMMAQAPAEQEPQRMEPDKCSGWQWYSWEDIPRPVFAPLQKLIDSGYRPPNSSNKGSSSS